MRYFRNTSGFTMVEMVIAVTIFSFMSIAMLSTYIQTTNTSAKLRMTRLLSESAREITERIVDDVRASGFSVADSRYDDFTIGNELWKNPDYTSYGGEILAIGSENRATKKYIFGKKQGNTLGHCTPIDQMQPSIHCGLYVVKNNDFASAWNILDSFVPEEEKKRVKLEHFRFYISGDGVNTEKKVTMVFTLSLMPRIGIPLNMVQNTKMNIQTTVSERFFYDF